MALTATANVLRLPRRIEQTLGRLARRARVLAAMRGLGILGLVGVILAVLGMAADFLWILPNSARWGIWLGWIALVGMIIARLIMRPVFRKFGLLDLAALAERSESQLGEGLTGAVGLVQAGHGSHTLINAVTEEAASRVDILSIRRAIPSGRALAWMAAGLAAVVGIVALSISRPDPYGQLAHRFLMPWADLDRVSRFFIEVPADQLVAIGSDFEVSATVRDRLNLGFTLRDNPPNDAPRTATLEWVDGEGHPQRVNMATESTLPASYREFTSRLPDIKTSLAFRVRSGSAISREVHLQAEPPPELIGLTAKIAAPAYVKQPDRTLTNPTKIEVWENSEITFGLRTSTPLKRARLIWPKSDESQESRDITIGDPPTITVVAEQPGDFGFDLEDERGLKSHPQALSRLIVRKDMPPTVTLQKSEDLKEAKLDDVILASVQARDDLAVAGAEVHWAIVRQGSTETETTETGKMPLPLEGLGTSRAQGDATLDLAKLKLRQGDVVTYRVRVFDSTPSPQEAWSDVRSLTINTKAEPLLARRDRARRAAIQARLDELKRDAATNRQEAEQLRYAADTAMRGSGPWDAKRQLSLVQRETQARSVVDRLNLLAHDLDEDRTFSPLAEPARQVANVEAEAGRAQLEKARKAEDNAKRLTDLRTADTRLAAVQVRLDDLQRQFDALARRDTDRDKLRLLAARQEDLAERAKDLDPEDQGAKDQLRNDQEAVRKALDDMLKQSPELRAEVVAAQAKEAEELAKRARELAERQREQARATTDLEPQQATLKALAETQRKIESDARMLALDVDPALADSGKARLNVDSLKRVIEPLERSEIEAARQRVEEAEASLRSLRRDLEDLPADPKAQALRLVKKQNELIRQVGETRRDAAQDTRDELRKRLKPLADRQDAIAKLAAEIGPPQAQKADAERAVKATVAAVEALRSAEPPPIDIKLNESRQALQHLANVIPDTSQREQENRTLVNRARQATEEAGREVERHLRETAPPQAKPIDAPKAAVEMAKRLENAVRKQKEALETLAKLKPDSRTEPQLIRAKERMESLAEAMEQVRQQAEPLASSSELTSLTKWRVVGPLPMDLVPPFDVNKPVDFKAPLMGGANKAVLWREVTGDNQGIVNLGQIYSQENAISAFGLTEIVVPVAGRSKLAIGSDDTLTIWLNGKQVYKFSGGRSHSIKQDQVEVELASGLNQVVIHCGNLNGEWKYSIATTAPTSPKFDRAASLAMRERLPQLQLEARAAAERLEQKANGQAPADELLRELADEQKALAEAPADAPDRLEEQRRIAAALRALNPPDAVPEREDAVRQAERAAKQSDDPEAGKAAAEAAEKLAAKLNHQVEPSKPREVKAPADPDLGLDTTQLAQARDLAKRQRQVRERLLSILGEKIAPQEDVRAETAKLGKELAGLRDRTREASPRSQGPAQVAAQLLAEEAPKAMDQGTENLAQARPTQARDAQRRAAELTERGAQAAEDLVNSLRTDRPAEAPPIAGQGELAEARDAMTKAGQNLEPNADQEAAEGAMRQAAQGLRSAAAKGKGQGKGQEKGTETTAQDAPGEGSPDGPAMDPKGGQASVTAADLAQLQEALRKKTGRTWGELPGNLRAELLKQSQSKYRDDYARLIQLYYREIAADAANR